MKRLVLAIAFIGFGSFAMAQQKDFKNLTPQQKEEMMAKKAEMKKQRMEKMKAELNLTDQQVNQINALHEKRMAEHKAQASLQQADRKAKGEAMNQEMKKILTPEQYAKWEANKKAKMEKRQEMMKDRKMMHKKQPAKATT